MEIEYPIFLVMSIVMGFIGALAHLWPYWTDFWRRIRNCQPLTQQVSNPIEDELEYLTDRDGYSTLINPEDGQSGSSRKYFS